MAIKKISALFIMVLMGTSVLGASLCGADCPSMAKEIKQDVSSSEMPCHESSEEKSSHKGNSDCNSECCFTIGSQTSIVNLVEVNKSSSEKYYLFELNYNPYSFVFVGTKKISAPPFHFEQIPKHKIFLINQQFLI